MVVPLTPWLALSFWYLDMSAAEIVFFLCEKLEIAEHVFHSAIIGSWLMGFEIFLIFIKDQLEHGCAFYFGSSSRR